MCFPLEHRFLCLVHVLTIAHVLTPVNVHHHRYDAHPTATLVPTLMYPCKPHLYYGYNKKHDHNLTIHLSATYK